MQKRSIVIFFFLVPFLIVALFLTSCYLTKKELNQGRRKEYAQRQQQTINEDSKFVHKKEITFLFCSLSCFLQQQQQLLFLWMCLFFFVTLRAEIGRFFARAVNVNPTNSSAKLLSQQQLLYSKAITFEQQHLHLFSSLFPWNLTDLSVSLRRKSFLASIFELLALSYSVRTPRHAWTRFVCHSLAIQHHLLLLIILILIKFEENGSGWRKKRDLSIKLAWSKHAPVWPISSRSNKLTAASSLASSLKSRARATPDVAHYYGQLREPVAELNGGRTERVGAFRAAFHILFASLLFPWLLLSTTCLTSCCSFLPAVLYLPRMALTHRLNHESSGQTRHKQFLWFWSSLGQFFIFFILSLFLSIAVNWSKKVTVCWKLQLPFPAHSQMMISQFKVRQFACKAPRSHL